MSEFKLVDDRKNTKTQRIPLSPKIRYNILRRDGFTCQYCGRTADERELEIDHIIPYSKGGTNDEGNLQVACKECNRGKMIDEIVHQEQDTTWDKNAMDIMHRSLLCDNSKKGRISDIDLYISKLSDEAKKAYKDCYLSDPKSVYTLCSWPGRIGSLATVCAKIGCDNEI